MRIVAMWIWNPVMWTPCATRPRGAGSFAKSGRATPTVPQPLLGGGEAADAALAGVVETGRGHAIGAVDLAGDVLAAGRPHAVPQAEHRALVGDPQGPLRPGGDVGHAVAQTRGGVRGEEV